MPARLSPDRLRLPPRLQSPRVAAALSGGLLLASLLFFVWPVFTSLQELETLRAQLAYPNSGVTSRESRPAQVLTDDVSSAALVSALASMAGAHGVSVLEFPRPERLSVADALALETYYLDLTGDFADLLRYARDVELGDGDPPSRGRYSIVHFETAVVRDRQTKRSQLRSRMVLRRLTKRAS